MTRPALKARKAVTGLPDWPVSRSGLEARLSGARPTTTVRVRLLGVASGDEAGLDGWVAGAGFWPQLSSASPRRRNPTRVKRDARMSQLHPLTGPRGGNSRGLAREQAVLSQEAERVG